MIIGCGVDLVEVNRIKKIAERWGDSFISKVFTSGEKIYCEKRNNKYQSYAGKFAAKEAFLKALGLGLRGVSWREIEIENNEFGQPIIRTNGKLKIAVLEKGITKCFLTISHAQDYAIAEVILEALSDK